MSDTPANALDIAALAGPASPQRDKLDRAIGEALASDGRFLAVGFPGMAGLDGRVRRLFAFFDQPEPLRAQLATETCRPGSGRLYRGYSRNLGEGESITSTYEYREWLLTELQRSEENPPLTRVQ